MNANYRLQLGEKATYTSARSGRKTHVIILAAERYPDGEAHHYTARKLDDETAPSITQDADQFSDYDPSADTRDPKEIVAEKKAALITKRAASAQTYRYVCLSCGQKTNARICACGGDTVLNTGDDTDPTYTFRH